MMPSASSIAMMASVEMPVSSSSVPTPYCMMCGMVIVLLVVSTPAEARVSFMSVVVVVVATIGAAMMMAHISVVLINPSCSVAEANRANTTRATGVYTMPALTPFCLAATLKSSIMSLLCTAIDETTTNNPKRNGDENNNCRDCHRTLLP